MNEESSPLEEALRIYKTDEEMDEAWEKVKRQNLEKRQEVTPTWLTVLGPALKQLDQALDDLPAVAHDLSKGWREEENVRKRRVKVTIPNKRSETRLVVECIDYRNDISDSWRVDERTFIFEQGWFWHEQYRFLMTSSTNMLFKLDFKGELKTGYLPIPSPSPVFIVDLFQATKNMYRKLCEAGLGTCQEYTKIEQVAPRMRFLIDRAIRIVTNKRADSTLTL